MESFLQVVREELRGNEELSDVAAFSAGPSPHEDCLAEDAQRQASDTREVQ